MPPSAFNLSPCVAPPGMLQRYSGPLPLAAPAEVADAAALSAPGDVDGHLGVSYPFQIGLLPLPSICLIFPLHIGQKVAHRDRLS